MLQCGMGGWVKPWGDGAGDRRGDPFSERVIFTTGGLMTDWPADKVERRAVADLVPYARNSRTHSAEQVSQIAASIKEWGWTVPILVDEDGGIIAGHGRVLAAQKLGLADVPCMVAQGWTEAQRRAYVIADNKLTLNGGWNDELLRVELNDLQDMGFGLELTGFSADELGALLGADGTEGLTDADAVPDVPAVPVTAEGDVWLLGRHRLMCGDSTSIDAVERLLDGGKPALVFTDPPYRMAVEGGSDQPIGRAAAKLGEMIKHLCEFDPVAFLSTLSAVFADGKMNAYVFCNKDLVPDYLNWAVLSGYNFNILFWKKPNAIPLGGNHRPDVEYLLLFRRSAIWNNAVDGVNYSKCLEFNRELSKDHPTLKPVDLIQNELLISSNSGSVVLDFFGGSGSTLIACEKNGRDCRMMELDPKYCDVIVTRWQDFTGQAATLESTGQTFEELKQKREAA
jgi:DNA modification methylase